LHIIHTYKLERKKNLTTNRTYLADYTATHISAKSDMTYPAARFLRNSWATCS